MARYLRHAAERGSNGVSGLLPVIEVVSDLPGGCLSQDIHYAFTNTSRRLC
jgi:hypothetical protein